MLLVCRGTVYEGSTCLNAALSRLASQPPMMSQYQSLFTSTLTVGVVGALDCQIGMYMQCSPGRPFLGAGMGMGMGIRVERYTIEMPGAGLLCIPISMFFFLVDTGNDSRSLSCGTGQGLFVHGVFLSASRSGAAPFRAHEHLRAHMTMDEDLIKVLPGLLRSLPAQGKLGRPEIRSLVERSGFPPS